MHRFLVVHPFKELADLFDFLFLSLKILFPLFCPLLVLFLQILHVLALALGCYLLSLLRLLGLEFLEPALQVLLVLVLQLGFLAFHSGKERLYSLWLLRILSLVPVFGSFQCLDHHQRGIVLYPAHHLLFYIEGWGIRKIPEILLHLLELLIKLIFNPYNFFFIFLLLPDFQLTVNNLFHDNLLPQPHHLPDILLLWGISLLEHHCQVVYLVVRVEHLVDFFLAVLHRLQNLL